MSSDYIGGRAYIGGTFDLFHTGHVRLLRRAKDIFDYIVVAVNSDEFATRYKRIPVMKLEERLEIVEACRYVDRVVVNHRSDSRGLILATRAQYVIHGADWVGEELMKQMGLTQSWLDQYGICMHYLPYTSGVSTTEIMERLINDTHL